MNVMAGNVCVYIYKIIKKKVQSVNKEIWGQDL